MSPKAARKKPKKPPRGSRPQPSKGSVLPLLLGAHNAALRAEIEVLRGVIDALLPSTAGWEQKKHALAKALLGDRPPVPVSEHMRKAMLEEVRKPKPNRGRPKKNDDAKLLLQVDGLRNIYAARDGRPYTDRQAITELVIEHRLMAPPRSMTREKAEGVLQQPKGEGVRLRTDIQTLVKAVQAERRSRRSGE